MLSQCCKMIYSYIYDFVVIITLHCSLFHRNRTTVVYVRYRCQKIIYLVVLPDAH